MTKLGPWPSLVPLDAPELPVFDLDAIPSWAGDFAKALAESTETPPELAGSMVLASISTAVARRFNVQVKEGYEEPCNLWFVTALPPGNRKSAVHKAAAAPLQQWEHMQQRSIETENQRSESDRATLEARIKELRGLAARSKDPSKANDLRAQILDTEESLPEIKIAPQLWTSDTTPERLAVLLSQQEECMAWLSSEGGIFDLLGGRYSNGIPNLDLVLKGHAAESERVDRGCRDPVVLYAPRITIGLSPQPEVLRGLAHRPSMRGRGLLARFLFLLPESPLGYRTLDAPAIPEHVNIAYADALQTMLDWPALRGKDGELRWRNLHLASGAYQLWLEYAHAMEREMRPDGRFAQCTDWASKAPGAAARLAALLHRIEHVYSGPLTSDVSVQAMQQALRLMETFGAHSLSAVQLMGADNTISKAQMLWSWAMQLGEDHFTVRNAFCALRGRFPSVAEMMPALKTLEERGYVKIQRFSTKRAGRPPSPVVHLRPEGV